jgi:hypothetical protein
MKAKFILLLLSGFISLTTYAQKNKQVEAEEDFSALRNKYTYQKEQLNASTQPKTIEIPLEYDSLAQKYDITLALNTFLDYVPRYVVGTYAQTKVVMEGWRIQIYRGRSLEEASRARQKCYEMFGGRITPYMTYRAPTYRVKVGDFLDPYECKPYLKTLKREFPTALTVPEIITVVVRKSQEREKTPAPVNKSITQPNQNE